MMNAFDNLCVSILARQIFFSVICISNDPLIISWRLRNRTSFLFVSFLLLLIELIRILLFALQPITSASNSLITKKTTTDFNDNDDFMMEAFKLFAHIVWAEIQ